MAKDTQTKPIEIHLSFKEVRFAGFSTTEYADNLENQLPQTEYEFQFELNMNFQKAEKTAEFTLKATVYNKNSNPKVELGNIKSVVSFHIKNFDDIIFIDEGKMKIPNELILTGASVSISTTRGMFVMCAATSKISNAVIPLVNPQKFLSSITNNPGILAKPHQ
jgi:hypothetical protein